MYEFETRRAPAARRTQARRAAGRAARALLAVTALASAGALATPGVALAAPEEAALAGVVNVNTASGEELALLPGIGAAKARAILAERERRGRFDAIEELLEVKGIGPAALERIRPFVAMKGRTTLAVR